MNKARYNKIANFKNLSQLLSETGKLVAYMIHFQNKYLTSTLTIIRCK